MSTKTTSINKIVFVSTIPPTQCGIATYTADTIAAFSRTFQDNLQYEICEVVFSKTTSTNAAYMINSLEQESYIKAAKQINANPEVKVVHIQHEFGLFGGSYGSYIFSFLETLKKPVVITFHSVLPNPSPELKSTVERLVNCANMITVMTEQSKRILLRDYVIMEHKIEVLPHGTHFVMHEKTSVAKDKLLLPQRPLLSTFGLLGEGKSIETALEALPKILEKYPDVLYLIIGKTHPHRIIDGVDVYRNYLEDLVTTFNLSQNVRFINKYLDTDELLEYLKATDIYMFTSKDPNQAVSGTFTYALSCSCPIVASKIPHTMEILSDDVGILVDIQNSDQFAEAAITLLNDRPRLEQMGVNAYAKSTHNFWENCAIKQMKFYEQVSPSLLGCKLKLPPLKWNHLKTLTNETGLLQFCKISEPNLASGLTLDDNARALIAMCLHYKTFADEDVFTYLLLYLEFIIRCQVEDGSFINYFTEHNQIDPRNFDENLDDANGRAIWALGTLISITDSKTESFAAQATRTLFRALPNLYKLKSPRAMAFCIKGLYAAYQSDDDPRLLDLIGYLGEHLAQIYEATAIENWFWFENKLTYANAILPEALLLTYDLIPENRYKDIAVQSMRFLSEKMFVRGKFKLISNKGWYEKGTIPHEYGEQPIDVCYMMVALDNFYHLLDDEDYKNQLLQAFQWYLGRNHLNHIMYNPITGSCFDGLEKNNVNLNQGAESTVCYLISWLVALQYYKEEKKTIPLYYSNFQKALSYLL